MPSWKTKFSAFYRIFTKIIAVFFFIILFHSLPFFPFKKSAQIVHYREYIYPEKYNEDKEYIGQDAGRIKQGAQNLAEIEKVENSILVKAKKKLQKKNQDLKKNQTLIEAKEKLRQAEKEHLERKAELEKKEAEQKKIPSKATSSLLPAEQEIAEEHGKAWILEKRADEYRQIELNKVRDEVIQNIQNELSRAELSITELNIELTKKEEWKECPWYKSMGRDPIRFFLIQPCQAISNSSGIASLGPFWDLLLKVLLMRLLLNWISYPPKLDLNLKPREKSEPTDLASLEEEKKLAMQQWEGFKQIIFNFLMSLLLVYFFSFHPYVIDRTNPFFGKSDKMIFWLAFYLIISLLSQFTTVNLYQKTSLKNYFQKNGNWFMTIGFLLIGCFFYYSRAFGDFLIALMSEVVNIFLNLLKKVFQRSKPALKKAKPQWKRKRTWNYKN